MNTSPCILCGRQDPKRVCDRCLEFTEQNLKALPVYYRKLEGFLKPGSTPTTPTSGGSTEAPLPVKVDVLSLRGPGGIAGVLTAWEDDFRDLLGWSRRPFRGNTEQTVDGSGLFLLRNWPWCADKHPAVEIFVDEITELVAACRLHTEGRSDVRLIGTCPVTGEDGRTCGAKLFAAPFLAMIRCRKCRTEWPEADWLKLARMMQGA